MKNYVHLGGAEMDNSLQGLRNSSYHAHPQILVRTLLKVEPLRDNLVSRALFPGFGGGAGPFPTPPPKLGKSALETRLITLSERRRREGSNWFVLTLLAEQLRRLLIQQLTDYLFSPLQVMKSELIVSLITEGIWRNSREGKWSRFVSCNCFWDRYWRRAGGQ